jgi:hypothetical protein
MCQELQLCILMFVWKEGKLERGTRYIYIYKYVHVFYTYFKPFQTQRNNNFEYSVFKQQLSYVNVFVSHGIYRILEKC